MHAYFHFHVIFPAHIDYKHTYTLIYTHACIHIKGLLKYTKMACIIHPFLHFIFLLQP